MAELDERERINRELREKVHIMLDNARGLIVSFQGPQERRILLNTQYDKFEGICSDRTKRYVHRALRVGTSYLRLYFFIAIGCGQTLCRILSNLWAI